MPAPRKRFGQHFLRDETVIQRILAAVDPRPDQHLVEIGPGRGALTLPLLDRVRRVHAVELDRDLMRGLIDAARGRGELVLHQGDALSFDFAALARGRRLRLVGNLPYNISTPLLFHVIAQADAVDDMTFMLQKEVADRLAASPGGKSYGRLSVMIQWRCEVERLFDVPPQAFAPAPKVHSSVVWLHPRRAPLDVGDPRRFADIVRTAFSGRRKTLRNSLRTLLVPAALQQVGIDPRRRAEELTVDEFARLSRGRGAVE